MKFDDRDSIIHLSPQWKGERFPNGRPKVPDGILRRMRQLTLEGAWSLLWKNGYKYQFEGEFKIVHPERILVGRAVTTVYIPARPDLNGTLLTYGHESEGRRGFFNQWVIDSLVEDDVAAKLIESRELELKKYGRSRFHNPRALDRWSGRSGASRMNFRWNRVRDLLTDLYAGLDAEG